MTAKTWLHGLGAAFIGGGSAAVTSAVAAGMIAPSQFDAGDHLGNSLKLMAASFLLNGALTTFAYLQKSPLPNGEDTQFIQKPNP